MGEWPGERVIFFRRAVGKVEAVAGVECSDEGSGGGLRSEDAIDGGGIKLLVAEREGDGMRLLEGPRLGIGPFGVGRMVEAVDVGVRC